MIIQFKTLQKQGFLQMKDISLRPKQQLMNLLDAVQQMENLPSTNRNVIIDRALNMALKSSSVNWNAVSEVSIDHLYEDKVPNHIVLKVDDEKFSTVNEQIKSAFNVEKITIPYTLKLLLTLYFIHLKQQTDNANQQEHTSQLLIPVNAVATVVKNFDTLAIKNGYEQSIYSWKKRLADLCKLYLRNNADVHEQLLNQCQADLKVCIDFIDLSKYLGEKATNTQPTMTYLAKILAGIFIIRIESSFEPNESKVMLDQIVKGLESEFQTIGAAIDENNSAEYYKNVYAKMMGGKL